jgi:hypothetical protein
MACVRSWGKLPNPIRVSPCGSLESVASPKSRLCYPPLALLFLFSIPHISWLYLKLNEILLLSVSSPMMSICLLAHSIRLPSMSRYNHVDILFSRNPLSLVRSRKSRKRTWTFQSGKSTTTPFLNHFSSQFLSFSSTSPRRRPFHTRSSCTSRPQMATINRHSISLALDGLSNP